MSDKEKNSTPNSPLSPSLSGKFYHDLKGQLFRLGAIIELIHKNQVHPDEDQILKDGDKGLSKINEGWQQIKDSLQKSQS